MTNHSIARVFTLIGDLMEIRGDNPFKIRAYRTAARTMEDLTESLEVIAERGHLREIPGVGDAISAKTREIIATGSCALLDRLRQEVPESLAELSALPGFGAKKVLAVWRTLGISDLDALESAAHQGRLSALPGFGEKSQAALLASIEAHRRRTLRVPIGRALPYAESLARDLSCRPGIRSVWVTGSLRRWVCTVGDIDLLIESDEPERVEGILRSTPEFRELQAVAPSHWSALGADGIRLDVRAVSPPDLAAALVVGTGSPAHVEQLRCLAAGSGLALGPLGLPVVPLTGQPLEREAAIYAALGLACVAPELREGRGEVELAAAGHLPELIRAEDLRGVLHAHSDWSDGRVSLATMAETAMDAGYAYHGATDHSKSLTVARGLDEERLRQQAEEIDALNSRLGGRCRVLRGIECDILADGTLDLSLECLAELELVVASVHSYMRQDAETITRRIESALASGVVQILGHPRGRLLGVRDPYAVDMDRLYAAAVDAGVALEINASPERLDLDGDAARTAHALGIPIAVNTDAHRPAHLAACRYGIAQARRAGLTAEDVINAWELPRLLDWLRGRPGRT